MERIGCGIDRPWCRLIGPLCAALCCMCKLFLLHQHRAWALVAVALCALGAGCPAGAGGEVSITAGGEQGRRGEKRGQWCPGVIDFVEECNACGRWC